MDLLATELDRLFAVAPGASPISLLDAAGRTRALVLEVVQPMGWAALLPAWQGAQAELDLPAPAIAVSGTDGLQLWFSLESAVDAAQGHAFLEALRARFLPDVPPARVRLLPDAAQSGRHAAPVPALQVNCVDWSAFVAPDLAVMFSDTPWLDIEPGADGQAALLRPLRSIGPAQFDAALARLREDASSARAGAPPVPDLAASDPPPDDERTHPNLAAAAAATAALSATSADVDPRRFLLRVMNDERVEMALRIEAAKALLQARD
jgi:hypothetical protein